MPRHRREVSMIEWVLRVTLLISYSYQREGLDKIIDWICSFTKHVGRRQKIEWWFGFGLFGDWTNQILSQPTTYTYRATTLFLLDVANVLSKNNNKNHLSFNTKDLIGTSTSFVRVFLHLQWFLKGGGIDFFPPILIFPLFLFLVFLSLNSFFFFFYQTSPFQFYLSLWPFAHCHAALRPFSTSPCRLVFGFVEVHRFGFFKARSINLPQFHPQMRPSIVLLGLLASCQSLSHCRKPSTHRGVALMYLNIDLTCSRVSSTRYCVGSTLRQVASALDFITLLRRCSYFLVFCYFPICISYVFLQLSLYFAAFGLCRLLSPKTFWTLGES
jgi:hypothetical protein